MLLSTDFSQKICIYCKAIYAIPKTANMRLKDTHEEFYCPFCGQSMYYPQQTEEEKLKERLEDEQRCCISARQEANSLERSVRAYKGHVTRLRKTG